MKNFKISTIIGFASILGLLMACNTAPAEKEVIIVPAATPVIVTPVIVEKEAAEPAKNTSITLDKNGMKVESEKVDVQIGK